MRLVRLLANLGYGSQRETKAMIRAGRLRDETGQRLDETAVVAHERLRLDGQPLDPPAGMVIGLHKPVGYTCSSQDPGEVVYGLLPPRFARRNPTLAAVGRLDRDTSGLLLLSDDGDFLHRVISPKARIGKVYEVTLARPLRGHEADIFASGTLMLRSEATPLEPATLHVLSPTTARLTITEGRYHQVRRMFAALGNHVEALHRCQIGGLGLNPCQGPGQWRLLSVEERLTVFTEPVFTALSPLNG